MVKRVSNDARANTATKVKAVARATVKATERNSSKESNVTLKQVIVGFVIACLASVLLAVYATDFFLLLASSYKYEPYLPKNVYVVLDTSSSNPVEYEVYYTVERETWYAEDRVVRLKGKAGTHSYVFALPVERIYNLRIDFGENPGEVSVNEVRLMGTQSALLNNFNNYRYNQFDKLSITSNGRLFFESHRKDPYMIYKGTL